MEDAPWRQDFTNPSMGFGQVNGQGYYNKQDYLNAKAAQSMAQQQEARKQKQAQVAQSNAPGGLANANGKFEDTYNQAANRQQSSFRGQQEELAGILKERADGRNLLSTELLRQGADRNIKQQMAMAAGARPGQVGMAMRGAAQNVGAINSGLAGQQTIAGLQEQAQAQGLLSGVLQGGRGQDLQFDAQRDATMLGATGGQAGTWQANMANETARYGIDQQRQIANMQQPEWYEKYILAPLSGGLQAYVGK